MTGTQSEWREVNGEGGKKKDGKWEGEKRKGTKFDASISFSKFQSSPGVHKVTD